MSISIHVSLNKIPNLCPSHIQINLYLHTSNSSLSSLNNYSAEAEESSNEEREKKNQSLTKKLDFPSNKIYSQRIKTTLYISLLLYISYKYMTASMPKFNSASFLGIGKKYFLLFSSKWRKSRNPSYFQFGVKFHIY